MPSLTTCPHCSRLYTHHSLKLHIPKCKENPNVTRRSFTSDVNRNLLRPRTRSLSRPLCVRGVVCFCHHCSHEIFRQFTLDELRLCYVCGEQFSERNIVSHEKECFQDWFQTCDRLAKRFESQTPIPLLIPSVDGTSDARRLNEHASSQAAKAQTLRCRRCCTSVPLSSAEQHQCIRSDPPIQFFF